MKLVMTILVRDEQDILRQNIEFHLNRGVDEIILMDNLSSDATADIAAEYVRANVLHYIFQPKDDYSQGRWVTGMARMACENLGADWVINSDADEFWWPGYGSLKEALGATGPDALAAKVDRTNFVPRPPGPGAFWERMDIRHRVSLNVLGMPLPSKIAHRAFADIIVGQGSHSVQRDDLHLDTVLAPISILHFPVRSRQQFINKVTLGGAAYARNEHLDPTVGGTWRWLYARYLEGKLDEEYANQVLDHHTIEKGLAEGSLIHDERLKEALGVLMPPQCQHDGDPV